MRALGYFTMRDLLHDRSRSALTVLNLLVVVVSYLLLSALSGAFHDFGRAPAVSTNLVIISDDTFDPMESSLDWGVLKTAWLAAPEQIRLAFPTIFRHMDIDGHVMQVRAVELSEDVRSALSLSLLQGSWPAVPLQAVISEGAVQITSWKVGDSLRIYGTNFLVTGIVRAGGNKFASVWMSYEDGQNLFGTRRGFQIGTLQLKGGVDPESVRVELQADPRLSGKYAVYLENSLSDRYNQISSDLVILSSIQALISLLAITFGTYNAVSLSLTERSREIQLLRVVGFSQGRIRLFLGVRTLGLTLAAYLLGWCLARLYIFYQQAHTPISIQASPLTLQLSASATSLGFLLTAAFAVLGVWLTLRQISAQGLIARGD